MLFQQSDVSGVSGDGTVPGFQLSRAMYGLGLLSKLQAAQVLMHKTLSVEAF